MCSYCLENTRAEVYLVRLLNRYVAVEQRKQENIPQKIVQLVPTNAFKGTGSQIGAQIFSPSLPCDLSLF